MARVVRVAWWLSGGVKFVWLALVVERWGSDDYSWWWFKELEFGVRYKWLRWGWLSDGVVGDSCVVACDGVKI
ncbi:hypothetical protein [Campylobacter lanienae]|uniref:hypothetical protein n=1 Tax=Campylobacter lanienae TaxID=75658 RepID=UPI00112FB8C0|nr:hypothetical protein [Campylobacter lanienae]